MPCLVREPGIEDPTRRRKKVFTTIADHNATPLDDVAHVVARSGRLVVEGVAADTEDPGDHRHRPRALSHQAAPRAQRLLTSVAATLSPTARSPTPTGRPCAPRLRGAARDQPRGRCGRSCPPTASVIPSSAYSRQRANVYAEMPFSRHTSLTVFCLLNTASTASRLSAGVNGDRRPIAACPPQVKQPDRHLPKYQGPTGVAPGPVRTCGAHRGSRAAEQGAPHRRRARRRLLRRAVRSAGGARAAAPPVWSRRSRLPDPARAGRRPQFPHRLRARILDDDHLGRERNGGRKPVPSESGL